jgi:hypothetical protein
MPTREELHRWLAGQPVEGLPPNPDRDNPPAGGFDLRPAKLEAVAKAPISDLPQTYTLSMDGKDAQMKVGIHAGRNLSDLAKSHEGRAFLQWILDEGFPNDLKTIARDCLVENPLKLKGGKP